MQKKKKQEKEVREAVKDLLMITGGVALLGAGIKVLDDLDL